ncbi:MAG: hypothetical protein IKB70_01290 [Bacilli bacterium]|nr:hypothetical protein [Bacilli bacterium]
MANFIYIEDYSKSGKMAISLRVFEEIIKKALENIPDVSLSDSKMKKKQIIKLHSPVVTTIRRGIVHTWVSVDIKKTIAPVEACTMIQNEITRAFLAVTDQVPFDVQVKVESILDA